MKKGDWVAIVCVLIILQIIFCWGIDISVSALINDPKAILVNGWNGFQSPALIYHLCLYGIILIGILQMLIGVHHVLKEEK